MWSGFYQGLLDYQKDVDKKKEKLAEKLEKRMEKLMTVAAARDASIKKLPSYKGSMVRLTNRLGGIEGAEDILRGVAAKPSSGPDIEKYIARVEKENGGIKLTGEQIRDAIEIYEIGGAAASNYVKTADYFASLEEKDLKDTKVYLEGIRQLSTMPTSQEGTFIYDTAPVQTFESERMKAQDKFLTDGLTKELTDVSISGMRRADGSFRTYGGVPLNRETISSLKEQSKQGIINLSKLRDDDGKYLFGLPTVKKALDMGTPQFTGLLGRNTSYQEILLEQIPQDKIQRLLDNGTGNSAQAVRERQLFDNAFGNGAAAFIINRLGG
jgi:hypothetical protein